jgi:sulfite exporter TauE/SafE
MLYTALIFGLISSLHCIGMCGPIAMMLPADRNNPTKKATQILTYHIGRLTAYAAIGFLFGLLGKGLFLAGIQQELSIVLGILMILVIAVPERIFSKYNFSKPVFRLISSVKSALGRQFKKSNYSSLFSIGLLNGFLPCGLVYVALFGAIAMQSIGFGMVYMILFGLGTIPMMSSVVYLNSYLTIPFRSKIQKIIPVVGVIIGILFIFRGLGLGIPYVSPSNLNLFVQNQPNCH